CAREKTFTILAVDIRFDYNGLDSW
nr:immunoglobulin heavy chain junction region [Macaca mulatta]MOV87055.1 immunoglobulin heavy chain junction region [Macaca mulatta]MOV88317.1 immunoglobulin heavy chain junction region [Macaca mulatta]MOV88602.1 immunoglobulin heavy chain junction region [Macaca mulatta]MOV89395.1 immunoglobulin heavy chain junction region [Macaca mulatta]